MKHWKLGVLAVAFSGSLYAAPLPVVASFSILGDVAGQIGGDRVKVQTIIGADDDAHAYHMTAADVQKLRASKLVLLNGLGLEKAEFKRAVVQNKIPFAEAAAGFVQRAHPVASDADVGRTQLAFLFGRGEDADAQRFA